MDKCNNCGELINKNSKYCPNCGNSVDQNNFSSISKDKYGFILGETILECGNSSFQSLIDNTNLVDDAYSFLIYLDYLLYISSKLLQKKYYKEDIDDFVYDAIDHLTDVIELENDSDYDFNKKMKEVYNLLSKSSIDIFSKSGLKSLSNMLIDEIELEDNVNNVSLISTDFLLFIQHHAEDILSNKIKVMGVRCKQNSYLKNNNRSDSNANGNSKIKLNLSPSDGENKSEFSSMKVIKNYDDYIKTLPSNDDNKNTKKEKNNKGLLIFGIVLIVLNIIGFIQSHSGGNVQTTNFAVLIGEFLLAIIGICLIIYYFVKRNR